MRDNIVKVSVLVDLDEMGRALPAIGAAETRNRKLDASQAGKPIDQDTFLAFWKRCDPAIRGDAGQPVDMPMASSPRPQMVMAARADAAWSSGASGVEIVSLRQGQPIKMGWQLGRLFKVKQ